MTLVFYDGVCGLCNHLVQFLLARDPAGRIRFAQLQGELARRELVPRGFDPADLDSMFVIADWNSPAQRVLTRSAAVLYAAAQLGGWWGLLARVGQLMPRAVADRVYTFVAARRYRLFGRFDSCPLPRPEWRNRFLDHA